MYLGVDTADGRTNGRLVAMKKIPLEEGQDSDGIPYTTIRVVAFLQELNLPNVVK